MSKPHRLLQPIDGAVIFREATSPAGLMTGWARVRANGGAAGGDGVALGHFEARLAPRITALSNALREGSYRPGPLRKVAIPKAKGGVRVLTIPCIGDRVAQSAVAQLLTPRLDAEFEDASFAYRPGRSVEQAVRRVEALRREGFIFTVDADIDNFFDTIPIDALLKRFTASVTDSPLTDLIATWLEQAAMQGRGIAQGSPLSPLLANLYLDELDEAMSTGAYRIVRYADDFVILTKDRPAAEKAIENVTRLLGSKGLAINTQEATIRTYDETLRFLGRAFVRAWALPDGEGAQADEISAALRVVAAQDEASEAEAEREEVNPSLDRGLRVLYIRDAGRHLTLRNQSFAVHESDDNGGGAREILAVHHSRVDRIELGPEVTTDLETIRHALASDVPLAFTDGHGRTLGHVARPLADRAARHLAQARHALDPALRLELARLIVEWRLVNMRNLLRRVNYRRGNAFVMRSAAMVGRFADRAAVATDRDMLMGFEGAATKLYWKAYSALLLHGFSLPYRRRRAGEDPVNIALDFVAHLLARDVGAVVVSAGLHPGFGVHHATQDYRDACVYDLMEGFRAGLLESTVLQAINNRALGETHFKPNGMGGKRLTRHGQEALIRAYEGRCERSVRQPDSTRSVTWRQMMRLQAHAYAAHVEGKAPFKPYMLDF